MYLHKRLPLMALLLLLLGSSLAQAQNSFTLKEAVEYALQNNVKAKNAQLDERIAKMKVREITTIGFPKISASYGVNNNYIIQRVIIPDGSIFNPNAPAGVPIALEFQPQYGGNASVNLNQLVFDGSYIVGLQAAKTYRDLAARSSEMTQVEVAENVKKAYYGVLVNMERKGLLDAALIRLDSSLTQMKGMYANGFIEKIDLDRLQVQRNNLAVERDKINRFDEISLLLLKFQMGYPLDQNLVLSDKLREINFDANILEQTGVNPMDRPEMRLLQTQKAATKLELKNIQAGYLPSIGIQASRGALAGANNFDQVLDPGGSWFAYGAIGFGVNWNLFDSFTKRYQAQQKRIEMEKVDNTIFDFNKAVMLQSSQASIMLRNSYETMKVQQQNLELSTEVLRVSRIKYQQGVGSNLEVINAEAGFREAQANYYNAVYDLLIAKVELEKAKGQLLLK
ncbi:MAG: TolC family protein [Sphingobacteriaceae bacterium]|nr:TolC family protein [Sphingobacteriaceae bacterium]